MKYFTLIAAGIATASPAAAADLSAADTAPPAPVEIAAPGPYWSGLYVGGQGGASFGNESNAGFNPRAGYAGRLSGTGDGSETGFVGGVHVGYDWRVGNVVFGALADINYVDGSNSRSFAVNGAGFSSNDGLDYLGTVRGRVGYAVDRVLVYGTGGLAYGGGKHDVTLPSTASGPFAGYTFTDTKDKTDVGYAVGGGVEVMATDHLSFGLEYLYTDLGKNDSSVSARNNFTNVVDFTTKSSDRNDFQTVMAKASYHFD